MAGRIKQTCKRDRVDVEALKVLVRLLFATNRVTYPNLEVFCRQSIENYKIDWKILIHWLSDYELGGITIRRHKS